MSVDRSEGSRGLFICLGREWLNPECIEAVTFVAEEAGASQASCNPECIEAVTFVADGADDPITGRSGDTPSP